MADVWAFARTAAYALGMSCVMLVAIGLGIVAGVLSVPFAGAVIGVSFDESWNGVIISPWLANLPGLLFFSGHIFFAGFITGRVRAGK